LNFGEKRIENELFSFIKDTLTPVDKTIWFDFRGLWFESRSAVIDSTFLYEIHNIAKITVEYSNDLTNGWYIDNVGKKTAKQKLSATVLPAK
jgi:hypothetical protein